MATGGALGRRKFPVSCDGVAFSRIRGSSKAAQIPEEGNRSLERERGERRERAGWEGAWRAMSVPEVHPNPSHGTKMLGKMLLTKKAHEKSLTSKSKV
jgi:hypothetical protein